MTPVSVNVQRGEVWVMPGLTADRKVVVVGAAEAATVLVVPISDSMAPDRFGPVVTDARGRALGVARIPGVGQVDRSALTARVGELTPASLAFVDMALRAALEL